MRLIGTFKFKGIALDMAKALTFPLPLLAFAYQQLILGRNLNPLFYLNKKITCNDCFVGRSSLVWFNCISNKFPISGLSHAHGNDDNPPLVRVISLFCFSFFLF